MLFDAASPARRVEVTLAKGRYDVSIARVDDGKAAISVYRVYALPELTPRR